MHKKFFKTASVVEAKDEGVISGYASVFNKVDSYGDTIDPKAYDAVIASKELPIMLFGHDSHSVPIGKWVSLEKDEVGLKVTGQLNLNNAKAKEVFDAIKFGSLTGLSVGFSVNEDGYDIKDEDEGFGFLIKNIERLYEISVVPLPADNFARIAECKSLDLDAINDIMNSGRVGSAGKKIVIEDYLQGVEISVLSAVSVTPEFAKEGTATIVPFLPARDHKRLLDGAKGPNTGGMGAICPLSDVSEETMAQFQKDILEPTLKGLIAEGFDYRGFIFFGVMLTANGPKLLEYNVRLGDPETQAVLPLMDFDFVDMCSAIVDGSLSKFEFNWKKGFQVAPVVVSGGYPGDYQKGKMISIKEDVIQEANAKVFIAGARLDRRGSAGNDGNLITSGGRVLACSAFGSTFDEAWKNAYKAIKAVKFDMAFYRQDIGLPGAAESGEL